MSDHANDPVSAEGALDAHFARALASVSTPNAPRAVEDVAVMLQEVERATPGGAGVHAQLDVVKRWHAVLAGGSDHDRYGGTEHIRQHVVSQIRLAQAAVDDYFRHRR